MPALIHSAIHTSVSAKAKREKSRLEYQVPRMKRALHQGRHHRVVCAQGSHALSLTGNSRAVVNALELDAAVRVLRHVADNLHAHKIKKTAATTPTVRIRECSVTRKDGIV